MFDHQVLDMFEIGSENYKSMQSFRNMKTSLGSKPCLAFNGPDWDSTLENQRLKTLLMGLWLFLYLSVYLCTCLSVHFAHRDVKSLMLRLFLRLLYLLGWVMFVSLMYLCCVVFVSLLYSWFVVFVSVLYSCCVVFVDLFRGPQVEKIRLVGLEQALTFTLSEGKVYARNYR